MNVIGEIVMPVKRWWRLLQKTALFLGNPTCLPEAVAAAWRHLRTFVT